MHIHPRSWIRCASYVVLALACLIVTHRGAEAGQTRMKVVLDTDIGTDIDDAWALGYALKSPSFELLGVTVSDADTPQRAKIVRFVYAVLMASDAIQTDPVRAQALVAAAGGFSAEDVRDSWRHHGFIADIPADLLDVLEQEERWLAQQDNRPARSRDELATLIDTSVFDEAMALAGPE